MRYIYLLFINVLLLSLTSCGFTPVHKKHDNNSSNFILGNINIEAINSIEGADLYNHLKNIIPYSTNSKYTLKTDVTFTKGISIIEHNSDVSRENVTIKVSYELKDKTSQKIITSGNFSRFSSFSTASSAYSNIIFQQDIQKNLAISAAEEIRNRIILFSQNKKIDAE